MVRQRSALLGLALSLAVLGSTACEDKTQVEIPPTPPPALQISVTPAAITINEGETAQLVAQVTGGETGGDKSVTWASSNTAVASVSANGNVVTVTGASAGSATISATANADSNVKAAAAVTVVAGGGNVPPTISIKSITTGVTNTPVNINNTFGQIEITLNLDVPQGTQVNRVEILADNEVIYTQSFAGVDMGLSLDEAQSAVELVASWNTADFTLPAMPWTVGTVQGDYDNGSTVVTAQVIGPQGTITANTSTTLVLNNTPFIYTVLSGPTNCTISTAGIQWCTGDIVVDALGVKFNGDAANDIASVTLTATGNIARSVTDGSAPFQLTLNKASSPGSTSIAGMEWAGVALTVNDLTAGGAVGPSCIVTQATPAPLNLACVAPANTMTLPSPLNEDNVAPAVTTFNLSPYIAGLACATSEVLYPPTPNACYVSGNPNTPAFSFAVRTGFYAHTDAGVGSPTATFQAGPAGSLIPVTSGSDLAESVVPNYIAAGTSCDALQNCRTVYAGPPAAAAGAGTVQTSTTGAQLFGVDSTDPTATVSAVIANMGINVVASPAWTISFSDAGVGPSGFSAAPVSVQVKKTNPAGSTCYVPDSPFSLTTVACTTSSGAVNYQADDGIVDIDYTLVPGTSEGYWEIDAFVRDQARNFSKPNVARITLNDVTVPVLGGIAGPSSLPGGQPATFTAGIGDNVDLGALAPSIDYGAAPVTFQWPSVTLGAYGVSDGLVSNTTGTFTTNSFMRAFEGTTAAGRTDGVTNEATTTRFDVTDVAGNLATGTVGINGAVQFAAGGAVPNLATISATIFAPANVAHGNFLSLAPSSATACSGTSSACGSSPPASTVLSATMTGPNATFANPFSRVEFYYQDPVNLRWYLIGSGTPAASDNTVTSTRTWTYSLTWTLTGVRDSAGNLLAGAIPVVAVGVHSSGSGVATTAGAGFGVPAAGGAQTVTVSTT